MYPRASDGVINSHGERRTENGENSINSNTSETIHINSKFVTAEIIQKSTQKIITTEIIRKLIRKIVTTKIIQIISTL